MKILTIDKIKIPTQTTINGIGNRLVETKSGIKQPKVKANIINAAIPLAIYLNILFPYLSLLIFIKGTAEEPVSLGNWPFHFKIA